MTAHGGPQSPARPGRLQARPSHTLPAADPTFPPAEDRATSTQADGTRGGSDERFGRPQMQLFSRGHGFPRRSSPGACRLLSPSPSFRRLKATLAPPLWGDRTVSVAGGRLGHPVSPAVLRGARGNGCEWTQHLPGRQVADAASAERFRGARPRPLPVAFSHQEHLFGLEPVSREEWQGDLLPSCQAPLPGRSLQLRIFPGVASSGVPPVAPKQTNKSRPRMSHEMDVEARL